jgi:signal peptidase II
MLTIKKKLENIILFIVIPFVGFGIDYTTKQIIIQNICMKDQMIDLLSFFRFVCVLNTGVSFGILANIENGKVILLVITVFILIFVYFLMYKERNRFIKYCYSIIISGAFGNIIDRFFHGGVIDFLDFHYQTHHYPAFNVADSLIFLGVCGIVLQQVFAKKA